MTTEELFEKLYPEEEAGVVRMLSKKFIVAFAEVYAQQLYDDNVQLKKQNKQLRELLEESDTMGSVSWKEKRNDFLK